MYINKELSCFDITTSCWLFLCSWGYPASTSGVRSPSPFNPSQHTRLFPPNSGKVGLTNLYHSKLFQYLCATTLHHISSRAICVLCNTPSTRTSLLALWYLMLDKARPERDEDWSIDRSMFGILGSLKDHTFTRRRKRLSAYLLLASKRRRETLGGVSPGHVGCDQPGDWEQPTSSVSCRLHALQSAWRFVSLMSLKWDGLVLASWDLVFWYRHRSEKWVAVLACPESGRGCTWTHYIEKKAPAKFGGRNKTQMPW